VPRRGSNAHARYRFSTASSRDTARDALRCVGARRNARPACISRSRKKQLHSTEEKNAPLRQPLGGWRISCLCTWHACCLVQVIRRNHNAETGQEMFRGLHTLRLP
jgi:hypothetical protein